MAAAGLSAKPPVLPGFDVWWKGIAAFLHTGGKRGSEWLALPPCAPVVLIVVCGGFYGAVMASYNGFEGSRALMVFYGAVKVPLLFLATMLTAVPSFYVLNLLLGVGDDFRAVWRGLTDYQMLVALQLMALAPVTALVNFTHGDYRTAQAWSTLMFAVAGWNARRSLHASYAPLIARNHVHQRLSQVWFVLYAFIGVQMGWDLRPFVGTPEMPVQFFRDHIGNAYIEIYRVLQTFFYEFVNRFSVR
ncbi:MAG TPA: hypothetical protein VEK08_21995 [Planctomycetota bacterium]|nr:hypothetical protein [Planctomycetota bacterium]